jgi:hypothetical protein
VRYAGEAAQCRRSFRRRSAQRARAPPPVDGEGDAVDCGEVAVLAREW